MCLPDVVGSPDLCQVPTRDPCSPCHRVVGKIVQAEEELADAAAQWNLFLPDAASRRATLSKESSLSHLPSGLDCSPDSWKAIGVSYFS